MKPAEAAAGGGVTASTTEVWVEAVRPGRGSVADRPGQYELRGVPLERRRRAYALAESLDMKKQEYWGDDKSYLFDPASESYERVSNLTLARWYPTLVGLRDGRVLGVSGLDQFGRMIQGHNEIYDPATKHWTAHPELARTLPTYPSLFLMPSGRLFYSGSNAGYGSDKVGRKPGIWDLEDNSFEPVPGLRDPTQTETSGSVLLPPAQDQRYMVAGGGGVGESTRSTARTDIADLAKDPPRFEPGPDLAEPTRYPNLVITPDDKVAITGGSSGYRGAGRSDHLLCHLYDPRTGSMQRMADPAVGRDYHSEALLLPDGRIVTLGGDPLVPRRGRQAPGDLRAADRDLLAALSLSRRPPRAHRRTRDPSAGRLAHVQHRRLDRHPHRAPDPAERGDPRDRPGAALRGAPRVPLPGGGEARHPEGRRAVAGRLVHALRDQPRGRALHGALGEGRLACRPVRAVQIAELTGPDGALRLEDLPEPEATHMLSGDRAVVVDVHAAGVSFPEVLQTRGEYQVKPPLPFVPGSEVAGTVRSAPDGATVSPGDRVAACCLLGGFAEVAVAPEFLTFPLSDELDYAQGAGLILNYHTAYFSLKLRGRLAEGETVLVHGAAGGVGTAAIQVARGLGARTIGVVSSDDKERVAREAGADEVVRSDGPWKDQAKECPAAAWT